MAEATVDIEDSFHPLVPTCAWSEDDDTGSWDTACGEKFQFTVDGPKENGFRHCPYCGRYAKVV